MITHLAHIFKQNSDELNAYKQAAYMKKRFLFFGLKAAERKKFQKEVFKKSPLSSEEELVETVLSLYDKEEREFHYAAIDLSQKYRKLITHLDFIEKLITMHSWWDSVDQVASNVLGYFLKEKPQYLKQMDHWIRSGNLWKRRSALIFQLKWKEETDFERLLTIAINAALKENFLLRKQLAGL